MATSFSNILTITSSSKITFQRSFQLKHPKFPITPKQKLIKSVISNNSLSNSPTTTITEKNNNNILSNSNNKDDNVVKYKYNDYSQLPQVWREIQGENDWAGLLEPMDPLLKSEMIRYGDMAQACYDAFDCEPSSKYYGTCRYPGEKFFSCLGMKSGYDVKCYLHVTAKPWAKWNCGESRWPRLYGDVNWAGYVAVSDDATTRRLGRRDITVAWRGTVTAHETWEDLEFCLVRASCHGIPSPDPRVMVEDGFIKMYTDKDESESYCKYSGREKVLAEVKRLLDLYSNEEEVSITITGHSLGAALAILNGYDIAESGVNVVKSGKRVTVTVMSFSGPKVGNKSFKKRLNALGVKVLRVVNNHDMVPKLPPFFYTHVGVELELNHKNSPYIDPKYGDGDLRFRNLKCAHNLEVILHLLDGYHGKDKAFVAPSSRDYALVNKGGDFLKDVLMIPPEWLVFEKKGLVKNKDGRWVQPERPKPDVYEPKDTHHYLTLLGLASSHDDQNLDMLMNMNVEGDYVTPLLMAE